jgi:hypothetical protein
MTTQAALGVKQVHPLVTPAADPKQEKKNPKSRIFNGHWLFAQPDARSLPLTQTIFKFERVPANRLTLVETAGMCLVKKKL